jgi:ribosomal protein S24E
MHSKSLIVKVKYMQIIERRENKLLDRVEIDFQINHTGKPTPTRASVAKSLASLEPGSKTNLIVVKDLSTRFGQALTTGVALIYANDEAISVEPSYVHERLTVIGEAPAAEPTPAPKPAPVADVSGGEE